MYTGGRSPTFPPTNAAADGALKGIFAKVFDLSISIACFIAHIFYAVYAQNSAQHARLFGFIQMAKGAAFVCVSVCVCICVCVLRRWASNSCQSWGKTAMRHIMRAEIPSSPFHSRKKVESRGKTQPRKKCANACPLPLHFWIFRASFLSRGGRRGGVAVSRTRLFGCIFPADW